MLFDLFSGSYIGTWRHVKNGRFFLKKSRFALHIKKDVAKSNSCKVANIMQGSNINRFEVLCTK